MSAGWLKFALPAPAAAVPALERALEAAGACAVSVTARGGDAPRFAEPDGADPSLWPECMVEGLFGADMDLDAVRATLAGAGFDVADARCERFADADWQARSRAEFAPLRFAGDLWIVPTWHAVPAAARHVLRIDPGMAFGTGTHPTTGLCLDWLGTQSDLTGRSVLDYGCGSGILALAARRYGAARVVGVDLDPLACRVARENAALNDCADIPFLLPEELGTERFDVLIANILLNPLIALAASFEARLMPNGRIGLSGLLAAQVPAAMTAYAPRFKMDAPVLRGEWAFLSGRKRA